MCGPERDSLIQRAVAGERFATQRLLLAEHDRLLHAISRRIPPDLRAGVAAEDICQDTYILAFQRISQFQPRVDDGFPRWLRTIAMRVLLQEIRARRALKRGGGRARVVESEEDRDRNVACLLEMVAVHEHTPSRSAAMHEVVLAVKSGLESLNADHSLVIRLRHIEGLSVQRVAEIMGRSEAAVTMLCRRGLARLREVIGDASRFFSNS